MKYFGITQYLLDVADAVKMFEEGLITDGELLMRMNDITIRTALTKQRELKSELAYAKRELQLTDAILAK